MLQSSDKSVTTPCLLSKTSLCRTIFEETVPLKSIRENLIVGAVVDCDVPEPDLTQCCYDRMGDGGDIISKKYFQTENTVVLKQIGSWR